MSEKTKPLTDSALAGEGSERGFCNAVEHGKRISRYGDWKKRSRQMASYILDLDQSPLDNKLGSSVASCSSWLVFNHYFTVDQVRLSKAYTCKKHVLCPVCAHIRGRKQTVKYMERLEEILKDNPNLVPAFLTLTVANGPDLEERFNHLIGSWKKYQNRRRQWIKTGWGFNELCKTQGAVFSIEVPRSLDNTGWHPHIHAIVLLDSYIDQSKISEEWEAITGDSYIVDIRKLKVSDSQTIFESFEELFKYALKFSQTPLEHNWHAYEVLRGKRLQGSYGAFRGVQVPEKMTDTLLDDLPYLELYYRYMAGKGYNLERTLKKLGGDSE